MSKRSKRSVLVPLLALAMAGLTHVPAEAVFDCVDGEHVWIQNVRANGTNIDSGATVRPGTLLRGELHFCVPDQIPSPDPGQWAPIIKFDPGMVSPVINKTWNDHVKFQEDRSDFVAETDIWEMVPQLNDPGDPGNPDDDQKIEGEHFSVFSHATQSCIYERRDPPQPTAVADQCDLTFPKEPRVWLDELRNAETGVAINPLLPVPQLTNVATTVHACHPDPTQDFYYAGLQFLPLDPGQAVAWQDEVKVQLVADTPTDVVITYQQIPPEPNRFAFIPIMWTGPGPRPGDNIGWVGDREVWDTTVVLETCVLGPDCLNGIVPP